VGEGLWHEESMKRASANATTMEGRANVHVHLLVRAGRRLSALYSRGIPYTYVAIMSDLFLSLFTFIDRQQEAMVHFVLFHQCATGSNNRQGCHPYQV